MADNVSPTPPAQSPTQDELPVCGVCKGKIEQVRFLDYGETRIIMHTGPNCALGVLRAE